MKTKYGKRLGALGLAWAMTGCGALSPPVGSVEDIAAEDAAAMKEIGSRAGGTIVWSSSRLGNHDIFEMNTDGSNVHQLTKGDTVDWFPRFSPDGSQILFCRSKKGWVSERDANSDNKWDLWLMNADGSDAKKIVDNASWGSWIDGDDILYVRGTKVFRRPVAGGEEQALVDSTSVEALDGALLQQPELSSDGRYLAITLRGSARETGIWDLESRQWLQTGLGCQINWTPDGSKIYWVNPTGNGGSQVFMMPIANGKPWKEDPSDDELAFIDLPGRRSHEYFPQLSRDGRWLVWGSTQRGHDHDIADYEIYLWEVGTPPEKAVRLTYHSGNDRWPDIFIPGAR